MTLNITIKLRLENLNKYFFFLKKKKLTRMKISSIKYNRVYELSQTVCF